MCENKDADQLRINCAADQRLYFRYTDSTIPLLFKSVISSLNPSSVIVQPGLCRTWSETQKTCFLTTRLKCCYSSITTSQSERTKCISSNYNPYRTTFWSVSIYSFVKDCIILKYFPAVPLNDYICQTYSING